MTTSPTPIPQSPYTREQLHGFRAEFVRQFMRYRQFERWWDLRHALVIVAGCALIDYLLDGHTGWTLMWVFGTVPISMRLYESLAPKPKCPACQREMDRAKWLKCCPGCGSGPESWGDRWWGQQCQRCQRRLWMDYSQPAEEVPGCTHCGICLDIEGH
jgi:hypothetical protein